MAVYLNVTNRGLSSKDFLPVALIRLRDDAGNLYSENTLASFYLEANAEDINQDAYLCANINPDQTCKAVVAFDVPVQSDHFVIVAGDLTTESSGDVLLKLP